MKTQPKPPNREPVVCTALALCIFSACLSACASSPSPTPTAAQAALDYWRQNYQNGGHFSPDGAWFIQFDERSASPLNIWLQSTSDSAVRVYPLTQPMLGDQAFLPLGPSAWSPTGDAFVMYARKRRAYSAGGATGAPAVASADIPMAAIFRRDEDRLQVIPFEVPGMAPPALPIDERLPVAWSADGQYVALSFDLRTIWVLNAVGTPVTAFTPELPRPLRNAANSRHFDEFWWAGDRIAVIVHDDWTAQELQIIPIQQPDQAQRYLPTNGSLRIVGVEARGRRLLIWQRPLFYPARIVHYDLDSGAIEPLDIPLDFRTLVTARQSFAYAAPILADGRLWLYNWATRQVEQYGNIYEIIGCAIDTCTAIEGVNRNDPFELMRIYSG